GADGDEDGDARADLLGIEQRHAPLDVARLLQLLDAPPARRGRQANGLADLGDGKRAVLLQDAKDVDIHGVEHADSCLERETIPLFSTICDTILVEEASVPAKWYFFLMLDLAGVVQRKSGRHTPQQAASQ